jgi:hypothetical protein
MRQLQHNLKTKVLNRIGERWEPNEEFRLTNRFNRGMRVEIMCKVHRRDVGGIVSRLERLGLVINTGCKLIRKDNHKLFMTYNDVTDIKIKINTYIFDKLGRV